MVSVWNRISYTTAQVVKRLQQIHQNYQQHKGTPECYVGIIWGTTGDHVDNNPHFRRAVLDELVRIYTYQKLSFITGGILLKV